ncbi:MAG TPA: hypothetical protein VFS55_12810 [Dokdonella sp.]|nr:hypothetical protein [Dokdonella sp.]
MPDDRATEPGYIQAWQCIGCGKIEAPQTCIGVCRDRKVYFVGRDEHEAALAEIARLRAQRDAAAAALLRFERATPREGEWRRSYEALQAQVRELRALLGSGREG